MNLSNVTIAALVDELKNRAGVQAAYVRPYENLMIKAENTELPDTGWEINDDGPAVVLVIAD